MLGARFAGRSRSRIITSRTRRARSSRRRSTRPRSSPSTASASGRRARSASVRGNRVELLRRRCAIPHSLGMLYSAFTYYTGFKVNSGEYKLMGLAPYGEPRYVDLILEQVVHDPRRRLAVWLDLDYFDYCYGDTMTSDRFHELFGGPPRQPDELITQKEMDLAASVQAVCETAVLRCVQHAHELTGCEEPRDGRRRGPELRGERPGRAGRARSSSSGCSPRPATPAARSARRYLDVAPRARRSRASPTSSGRPAGLTARSRVPTTTTSRCSSSRSARSSTRFDDEDELLDRGRRAHRAGTRRRLVPGPHGVRPAGARVPQHHRRSPRRPGCSRP